MSDKTYKPMPVDPGDFAEAKALIQGPPKHPSIVVQISGEDGNVFSVVGSVKKALQAAHLDKAEIDTFVEEALAYDYVNAIYVCMKWVDVK